VFRGALGGTGWPCGGWVRPLSEDSSLLASQLVNCLVKRLLSEILSVWNFDKEAFAHATKSN
jgi:hypothetical protein